MRTYINFIFLRRPGLAIYNNLQLYVIWHWQWIRRCTHSHTCMHYVCRCVKC